MIKIMTVTRIEQKFLSQGMIKPNKLIQTCFETRFYFNDAVDYAVFFFGIV